jgi:hypothetical protein
MTSLKHEKEWLSQRSPEAKLALINTRLEEVLDALPGTLPEICSNTKMSLNTVRVYLRMLLDQELAHISEKTIGKTGIPTSRYSAGLGSLNIRRESLVSLALRSQPTSIFNKVSTGSYFSKPPEPITQRTFWQSCLMG